MELLRKLTLGTSLRNVPNKMRYFHIQRINGIRKEWKKGESSTTERDAFNEFFLDILKGIEQNKFPINNRMRLISHSKELLNKQWIEELDYGCEDYKELFKKAESYCFDFENIAHKLFDSHHQYLKWIREEIFESTRKELNPELPSRKKCLWLCNEDNLEFWWSSISDLQKRKIIELELNDYGKLHISDEEFLDLDTYSIQEFSESSVKYWEGQVNSDSKLEILYEGKFKVISEFNELNEI